MTHEAIGADCGALRDEDQEAQTTRGLDLVTMSPSTLALRQTRWTRRLSTKGTVSLSALALLISCTDNQDMTAPPTRSSAVLPTAIHKAAVSSDVVIMHRSTYIAAHDGIPKVNKNVTERITGAVRLAGSDSAPVAKTPARAEFTGGALPRPVIALPARAEAAMCSSLPAWSHGEQATAGGRMKSSGVGDGPASILNIVTADGTVLTVERTWVRTANTWELSRQVTTTADNRFRDEVTYEHQSAEGTRLNRAIPLVACANTFSFALSPQTASHSFYAAHTSTLASRLFPLSGETVSSSCGADDCFYYQNAVYAADAALVATAGAAAIACMWTAIVVPPVCAAALVTYGASVAALYLAQRALKHCLGQSEELRMPEGIALAGSATSAGSDTGASRLVGTVPKLVADCAGAGGAGGGDPLKRCHDERWEISYDGGWTWSYFDTVQVCDAAA
ncbi:MAG: hypothetical protein ABI625_00895 [bacterium]